VRQLAAEVKRNLHNRINRLQGHNFVRGLDTVPIGVVMPVGLQGSADSFFATSACCCAPCVLAFQVCRIAVDLRLADACAINCA